MAGGITWNNAPANDTGNGYGFTSDSAGSLGDIIDGGEVELERSMSSEGLVNFLNTDTDGQVTLMMARQSNSSAWSCWAAREHATLAAPKLELTYTRAGVSPYCGMEGTVYLPGDINFDCFVDFNDLALALSQWLYCSHPGSPQCDEFYKEPTCIELAGERWNKWRLDRERFPTAGWDFINTATYGENAYNLYAGANFSMIRVREANYQKALDAGLEVIFGWWEQLHNDPARLDYYMDYPMPNDTDVIGYFLDDEPNEAKSAQCGQRSAEVYAKDIRNAIPMVNHSLPLRYIFDYDCPSYIIKTKYCLLTDGSTRDNFYGNLEDNRMAGLANNIGTMAWVLTTQHTSGSTNYRQASESDVFWQVYSIVGYGCQGVWYYRYHIDPAGGSFLDSATVPNALYYYVQAANGELDNIWQMIKHLRSVGVYHSQDNPAAGIDGARNLGAGWNVEIYEDGDVDAIDSFVGDNFLLGAFENGDDDNDDSLYLLIQNKRHAMDTLSENLTADCTFEMESSYSAVFKYDPQSGASVSLTDTAGEYGLTLGGGKGILLRFDR